MITTPRAIRALAVILAGVIGLGACVPVANVVRIEPGATADSLRFVVSGIQSATEPGTGIYGLSVVACGTERSLWTVAADGTRLMPMRVAYGQALQGFPTRTGPFPLTRGCYEVFITNARTLRFDIDAAGAIHAQTMSP
jgi:hypothetical protein